MLEGLLIGAVAGGGVMFVLMASIRRPAGHNKTTGGTPFNFRGDVIQLDGPYTGQVYRFMKNHERNALNALTDQGRLEEAQTLFDDIFARWLVTEEGQRWAERHAPFLLN